MHRLYRPLPLSLLPALLLVGSLTFRAAAQRWEDLTLAEQWERRDQWQLPERVIDELHLEKGDVVAGLGAGRGYFTRHLAKTVGPSGRVLALDVNSGFLDQNRAITDEIGYTNVEFRLIPRDSSGLAYGEARVILISRVWHFLPERFRYAAGLRAVLRPDDRVFVLGSGKERVPAASRQYEGSTSRDEIWREAEAGGLRLVAEHDSIWDDAGKPAIRQKYFMEFKVAEGPIGPPIDGFVYVATELAFGLTPDDEGVRALTDRGFLKVIDLRDSPTPALAEAARSFGLVYETMSAPSGSMGGEDLEWFARELHDPEDGIVFLCGDTVRELRALLVGLWMAYRLALSDYLAARLLDPTDIMDDPLVGRIREVLTVR
jgi:SAM-dependent methyltransferase